MTQLRRPRFSIAEIMALVAGGAVVLVWPRMFLPVVSTAVTWLLHYKMGLPLLVLCMLIVIVGFIAGLVIPLFMRPVIPH